MSGAPKDSETRKIYGIWKAMRQRCRNPRSKDFPYYGGRGIEVCQRWDSFSSFMIDVGARPNPGSTLERNDTNGDYEKDNCRWATRSEQSMNKRAYRRRVDLPSGVMEVRGRYRATVTVHGRRHHLGYFPSSHRAAEAVQAARLSYGFNEKHGVSL
jgi:hypothetical protein